MALIEDEALAVGVTYVDEALSTLKEIAGNLDDADRRNRCANKKAPAALRSPEGSVERTCQFPSLLRLTEPLARLGPLYCACSCATASTLCVPALEVILRRGH